MHIQPEERISRIAKISTYLYMTNCCIRSHLLKRVHAPGLTTPNSALVHPKTPYILLNPHPTPPDHRPKSTLYTLQNSKDRLSLDTPICAKSTCRSIAPQILHITRHSPRVLIDTSSFTYFSHLKHFKYLGKHLKQYKIRSKIAT
jgi:hypothetical protein